MPPPKAKGCISPEQVERAERRFEAVRAYTLRGAKAPTITRNLIALQTNDPGSHDYFDDATNYPSCYRCVRRDRAKWEQTLDKVVENASPHAKGKLVERLELVIELGMRAWQDRNEHILARNKGFDKAVDAMVRVARVLGVDTELKLDLSLYVGAEDPAMAAARAIRDFVAQQKAGAGMSAADEPAVTTDADEDDRLAN